jgi:adenylate cyclase
MDTLSSTESSLFEGFRLDRRARVLFRRDERGVFAPMAIGSRALDILGVLVERPGALVSRAEIIEAVWPGTTVEDSNLNVQVAALRRIVDDGRAEGSCIQTVPGRGYRFVAPVTRVDADAHSAMQAIAHGCGERSRPRLSIVVLPFTNLSDDREQQYFADGITEDLTADLSRIPGMFVISCNTAFTYKARPVDTRQIGRELGVRYVLEGSVRRSDNRIRINAQLIDAETDAHLWAERFDRDTKDLFAVQDEITSRIAIALNLELTSRDAARLTQNPDALDCILWGRAAFSKPRTRNSFAEIISLFERALSFDPRSVEAQSALALALTSRALEAMSDSAAADLARAEELVGQALATSPHNPSAHYAKGQVLRAYGRPEEAIPEYETAIALNRNWVFAHAALGACKLSTGSIDEAIPLIERAIRLSPRDPYIGNWYWQIGMVHLLQSHIDEAILWLEKARSANSGLSVVHACLASAYALKAETERAAVELADARRLSRGDRYSNIARLKAVGYFGVPKIRALYEATYFAGLRKAGMPEK